MNTVTIHGMLFDPLGLGRQHYAVADRQRGFDVRTRFWQVQPEDVRSQHPAGTLNVEHGQPIGRVIGYARSRDGSIWATALTTRSDLLRDRKEWFFSAEINAASDYSDVELTGLALVRRPAQTCLRPVAIYAGDATRPEHRSLWRLQEPAASRVEHAGVTWRRRASDSEPLHVYDQALEARVEQLNRSGDVVAQMELLEDQHWRRRVEHRPCVITAVR